VAGASSAAWVVVSAASLFSWQPAPSAGAFRVAVEARSVRPGELVFLTVVAPADTDEVRVHAFDRRIPTFNTGPRSWRALVGIDLDTAPGRYQVSIDALRDTRAIHTTYELHVLSRTFPTRRLHVDESLVNPPASAKDRIERDAADLKRIWGSSAPQRFWTGTFVQPVPGAAGSRFGTRSIYNGVARPPHTGTDFLSPTGTPIQAPAGGRIVLARDLYFSGNTIVIDHGLGLFSLLAHLSAFDVHEGDSVAAGQQVGRVGATGRVTGPHLHWAVRVAGARVDPLSVLAVLKR
jgi:murein DD-endopeptidase MepM/ murein hydrolase activator NlpD